MSLLGKNLYFYQKDYLDSQDSIRNQKINMNYKMGIIAPNHKTNNTMNPFPKKLK